MKILETGTLSNVTLAAYGSGVSTPPIDLTAINHPNNIAISLSLEGDLGRTGSSVSVIARHCHSRAGVTWPVFAGVLTSGVTKALLVNSGTSKTGFLGDGSYIVSMPALMPWLRLEAISGGAGVTNNMSVRYAVAAF